MRAAFLIRPQNVASVNVEEIVKSVLAKIGVPAPRRIRKRGALGKRDTVIFAAILMDLKGPSYCSFLQNHGVRPKWSDSGPVTYQKSYQTGEPWRKKVQDEKTRAKSRISRYVDSELANAFNAYLPDQFDKISLLLHSRNSHDASKTSGRLETHKY
jgi:Tfp pilus assembly major pilin PilA